MHLRAMLEEKPTRLLAVAGLAVRRIAKDEIPEKSSEKSVYR